MVPPGQGALKCSPGKRDQSNVQEVGLQLGVRGVTGTAAVTLVGKALAR